jgi:hypothetical protein
VVKESAVVGDSVVGLVNGDSASFALSKMDKIQVRKGDWVGTTLLVFGTVVGASLVAIGVALATCSGGYVCPR